MGTGEGRWQWSGLGEVAKLWRAQRWLSLNESPVVQMVIQPQSQSLWGLEGWNRKSSRNNFFVCDF